MSIRRINLYGGPGSGKSSLAARIFSELKVRGYDVEHVSEYIKTWAHEGKVPESYDQLYVFAKQLKTEDLLLRNVGVIVTDSPILLNTAYSRLHKFQCVDHLVKIAQQFDIDFPPLNLFLNRTVEYVNAGRYQNKQEAEEFDQFLQNHLDEHLEGEIHYVQVNEISRIISLIEERIPECRITSLVKKPKPWYKRLWLKRH